MDAVTHDRWGTLKSVIKATVFSAWVFGISIIGGLIAILILSGVQAISEETARLVGMAVGALIAIPLARRAIRVRWKKVDWKLRWRDVLPFGTLFKGESDSAQSALGCGFVPASACAAVGVELILHWLGLPLGDAQGIVAVIVWVALIALFALVGHGKCD